jgi:hypothetical protein
MNYPNSNILLVINEVTWVMKVRRITMSKKNHKNSRSKSQYNKLNQIHNGLNKLNEKKRSLLERRGELFRDLEKKPLDELLIILKKKVGFDQPLKRNPDEEIDAFEKRCERIKMIKILDAETKERDVDIEKHKQVQEEIERQLIESDPTYAERIKKIKNALATGTYKENMEMLNQTLEEAVHSLGDLTENDTALEMHVNKIKAILGKNNLQ